LLKKGDLVPLLSGNVKATNPIAGTTNKSKFVNGEHSIEEKLGKRRGLFGNSIIWEFESQPRRHRHTIILGA